ncbi:MAG TPA: chemotaxis protein CheW [Polyangiales bacterium]|nr:chemotaxis protein CheW [Polyangiales bacterium]
MTDGFDRSEFVGGYLAEVEEHLGNADGQLLKLEQAVRANAPQLRMLRELFRALHTIKGLSAMVSVEPVVELAHELEAVLRTRDRTATPLNATGVELLFRGVRAIALRVRSFAEGKPVEPAPQDLLLAVAALQTANGELPKGELTVQVAPELLAKLTPAEREQLNQGLASGQRALQVDFSPSPERAAEGLSITTVRERVGALAEIVKVVPRSVAKSPVAPSGLTFSLLVLSNGSAEALAEAAHVETRELVALSPAPSDSEPPDRESSELAIATDTIRVDVRRLDDALDRLSSLIVSRHRLERAVRNLRERGADVRELEALLGEHRRELRHLRGALTHARMVPMQQLLERVPLLVRGMARESGKRVRLEVDARHAELDKAVAERMFPALLHLVRNAVDHGIESAEQRRALGKPEEGVITVRCTQRTGNLLELSVGDDGGGIDRARVAAKAEAPVPADDRELLALITRPGLSTRDAADARSGRGMGMDIVRQVTVSQLGGELSVRSELGLGTTFTMRLPMSVSIFDSFVFRCGPQSFVVPLSTIEEVVELDSAQVVNAPAPKRRAASARILRRHGENIPLFELSSLFALEPKAGLRSALVVRREDARFAFSVDHMLGQQEVVVRPLEDPLVRVPGITGSTDLGDGRPTLVLDLWALQGSAGSQAVQP